MKRILIYIISMCAAVIILPLIITSLFPSIEAETGITVPGTTTNKTVPGITGITVPGTTNKTVPGTIKVKTQDNKIIALPLEDYIRGVVASEMPASFGLEALKAQAVVSRTFAVTHMNSMHDGADVCDSYLHCQQWKPFDEKMKDANIIERAVAETENIIIYYKNEPINAFFHSNSCGRTENVEDVWDSMPIPYLKSVESPGENENPEYYRTIEITVQEMMKRLDAANPFLSISAFSRINANPQLSLVSYTAGGRVNQLNIEGVNIKGTVVRALLNLKSSCFSITLTNNGTTARIITEGSGHGVGLSQWGAKYMASKGSSYHDIIKHYYTSVTLGLIK